MNQQAILIGIAGGTGSGKTSVAREVVREFSPGEVVVIDQDSYYRDLSSMPLKERHQQNFDHPEAIDFSFLCQQMKQLLEGSVIQVPVYNFTTHNREAESRQVKSHHVVILEGILVLSNPELRDLMDIRVFVETPDDIRFIRRLSRDIRERGRDIQSVIDQYLGTVRPMYEQFVEPSKFYADIIIPEGGHNSVAIDLLRTKIRSSIPSDI